MFVIFTKRKIIKFALSLIIFTLIVLVATHGPWDQWVIHYQMPEPNPAVGNWHYQSIFGHFTPALEGYSILVDLDRQRLILYESEKEIKSWPVSGGSKENPSPTGLWIVTDIGNWGQGFGGSWIALNVPWGKYGIHGTVNPWVVGNHNISHGCIRMKNQAVSELKKYISIGVLVYIKHDTAPFRVLMDGKVRSDVLELQVMLKQLGYYDGVPDGRFGTDTYKALCQFQIDEQIKVDGTLGEYSWSLLEKRVSDLNSDYLLQ